MKKSEKMMLGVLGLLLIPLAFLYLDYGGATAQNESPVPEKLSDPMDEVGIIKKMIQTGARNVENITLSSWGRDIFSVIENTEASNVSNQDTRFFLSGIMTSGLIRSAVINDQVVTEGSLLDRYIVESIQPDMVILSRNGKKLIISLDL